MPQPGSTTGGARRRPGRLAAGALLCAAGCNAMSPYIEHSYVRAAAPVLFEPIHNIEHDDSGPWYGGSTAYGTYIEQDKMHATGLEFEYALRRLGNTSPMDGWCHSYYGGVRRFWNLDQRFRPHVGVGGVWEDFDVRFQPSGHDSSGIGLYADIGLDYMITPYHSIGVRLRDQARYEYADQNHGIVNGVEFALVATWNF
jgi:hypothetical protein